MECLYKSLPRLRAGETVIYLDTEGFSVERFRQLAGHRAEELARNLFLFEPMDFEQQGLMIADSERLLQKGGTGPRSSPGTSSSSSPWTSSSRGS